MWKDYLDKNSGEKIWSDFCRSISFSRWKNAIIQLRSVDNKDRWIGQSGSEFLGFRNFRSTARWGLEFRALVLRWSFSPGTLDAPRNEHIHSIRRKWLFAPLFAKFNTDEKKHWPQVPMRFLIPFISRDNKSWYWRHRELIRRTPLLSDAAYGGKMRSWPLWLEIIEWASHRLRKNGILYSLQ